MMMATGDNDDHNNDNDDTTSKTTTTMATAQRATGYNKMATTMAADNDDNNVNGDGTTGNKVNNDGNGAMGRLLLMSLGTIVSSSTRTPTGNSICTLFYYAVIVMNGSPSL